MGYRFVGNKISVKLT